MSYANAWLKWFDVIEGGAAPLTDRMIALSELQSKHSVLDIGTGLGEPALSVATKLDKAGHVLAVDHDPNMIALAQERAKERGVSNIEYRVTDAETLDLLPNSLDVVFARWSLMFVGDLERLLSRLCKALRPKGKLVAATWASADLVPALNLAKATVQKHFDLDPAAQGQPKAFGLSDCNATKSAFIQAGFREVSAEPVSVAYEFSSPAQYIQYRLDVAGPLWVGLGTGSANTELEARAAIEKALQRHQVSTGRYRLVNRAYCFVGNV
jgi:ubiquinone/menaquinone biosynthesis C-methylase UbiE